MTTHREDGTVLTLPWFGSEDWPLANDDWPGTFPQEYQSESGLTFVIDLVSLETGDERCMERTSAPNLDGGRDYRFCFMQRGHDTPHMPMDESLIDKCGAMIVRSVVKNIDGDVR